MHQKKSDDQIAGDGENAGLSSDFNPPIPLSNSLSSPLTPRRTLLLSTSTSSPPSPILRRKPQPSIFSFTGKSVSPTTFCRSLPFLLLFLLSLPLLYLLLSRPRGTFLLDFLSAFSFSSALLFSLNPAVPRLISRLSPLRRLLLLLRRSGPPIPSPHMPVVWSIGREEREEKGRRWSGCWVQGYSNGEVYEGEFHKGVCSGSGVHYYQRNGRYEGEWVEGKCEGYGVETWGRGSRYRGQYRKGLRHGYGVYVFFTGDVYSGQWSNGYTHGYGAHTCRDHTRYTGEFKWGVKHGIGHYHFRNGDEYGGEYFADKMHGFGVYRFSNGHRYEGAWHEGRRQGLGMYTFRNGETQCGHWECGILDLPTFPPPSPSSSIHHSRVVNAVQEARRREERACRVGEGKVEERVKRAVAGAKRAANAARVAAVKAVQNSNGAAVMLSFV